MSFASRIRRLAGETAVYGLATIVGRFVNFLLVPLYTNVYPPSDYGVIANLYAWIALATVFYLYGLESAYFRFASRLEKLDPVLVFSTAGWTLAASAGLSSLALAAAAEPLSLPLGLAGHAQLIRYAAAILFLDTCAALPFAFLRLEGKAHAFAAVKLVNIGANVALNLWLILGLGLGIEAILISGLAASALSLLLLLPVYEARLRAVFSASLLRQMLGYGLPLMPMALAAMVIQVADRPILQHLSDEATVGIYQANHKLGIFMMLVVSMFQYAWQPFSLQRAQDPDARQLFARVLTYFVLVAGGILVALSLFVGDLVRFDIGGRHLIGEAYWSGLGIVPVVLLAYLFYGVYVNLTAGASITKRTGRLAVAAGVGAALAVAANLLLIPRLGMLGAAWAQCLAYVVMAGLLYVLTRRLYPVPYEWGRLARIGLALVLSLGPLLLLGPRPTVAARLLLLLVYPATLALSGFAAAGERARLRQLLTRLGRGRA